MPSEFLQGFQAGANLFSQAKQLQEARQRSMMQAQEMLQNIRAAQAMEQYRNEQMQLARAEEARKAAEWQQAQQLEQDRLAFIKSMPQMREDMQKYYGLSPEELQEHDAQVNREYAMKYGPNAGVSYLQSAETTRRSQQLADERMELERYRRGEIKSLAEEDRSLREKMSESARELKLTPAQQSAVRISEQAIADARRSLNDLRKPDAFADETDIAEAEARLERAKLEHRKLLAKFGDDTSATDDLYIDDDPTSDVIEPPKTSGKFKLIRKSVR